MILNDLKSSGCLPSSYQDVSFARGSISISDVLSTPIGGLTEKKLAVVVDDCSWAATVKKMPVNLASTVYSCNAAGEIGCWKSKDHTFYRMQLKENKLLTKKIHDVTINFMGDQQEEYRMNIEDLSTDVTAELMNELNAFSGEDALTAMNSTDATTTETKAVDEKVNAIRSKVGEAAVRINEDIILNNRRFGRALFFITKTDPAIKVSVRKVPLLDAQGRKIPQPTAGEAALKKFKETGVIKASLVETEKTLEFKQSKPPKAVAMVISTPAGSDISLTKIGTKDEISVDSKETTMKNHVISMEAAYSYIAFNYGGQIKESDTILGAKATWLRQTMRPGKRKSSQTGEEGLGVLSSLVVEKKDNRTLLYTDGNYFPLKTFQTIAQQDLSNEDATVLNLNIEAAMKNHTLADLSEVSKDAIHMTADGTGYESSWFNSGAPIVVKAYDDKDRDVTNVRIPCREKVKVKNKENTYSYKFVYDTLDDMEHGPLSNQAYRDLVKLTGMSDTEFIEIVKPFGKANRTSQGKKDQLTIEDYLKAKMSKKVLADGTRTFFDLQKEMEMLA